MIRLVTAVLAVCVLAAGLARAQDGVRRGTVKKLDADKGTVTLTADGRDQELTVTPATRAADAAGRRLGSFPWKDLKEGQAVHFKADSRDGKTVLVGLKMAGAANREPPPKTDTSHLKPLTELGAAEYHGFPGGLYPGGANERPAAHEAAGRQLAGEVRPLDADGRPSSDGKIVLLSIGMSNTNQVSQGFQRLLAADRGHNPRLVFVNGSQGGMTAAATQDPDDGRTGTRYWTTVDERLKAAGVTRAQVQAAWIKQADAGPTQGFPKYAETLRDELRQIARAMHRRFPNLKMVYLSSRTYGGFARTGLNPEPYAFESGLSVKWLIEEQIKGSPELNYDPAKGPVQAPWLAWGPYLWANGPAKNPDGLSYEESDFAADGTHPSPAGQRKVAGQLLTFFKTDPTAKSWFVRGK